MPRYLITATYTAEGAKGLLEEGGSGRKTVIEKALKNMGGKLDAMYYAYGETDVVIIVDMPDGISLLSLSLAANASGTVKVKTTPLVTVEEIDAACKNSAAFWPAGGLGV